LSKQFLESAIQWNFCYPVRFRSDFIQTRVFFLLQSR